MIDLIRVGPFQTTDVSLAKIDFPPYVPLGETSISGILFNQGIEPINQIQVNWRVDEGPFRSELLSGLSVAKEQTCYFTLHDKYMATEGNHKLKVWISKVNEQDADENQYNDTLRTSFKACPGIDPKVCLFEVFTSSTCGSCPGYNRNVRDPVTEIYKGKIAVVKYQTNFWPW